VTPEEVLKGLRTKQRLEVDKLKKKMNYDETRNLLEKYDERLRESVAYQTPLHLILYFTCADVFVLSFRQEQVGNRVRERQAARHTALQASRTYAPAK
jgi:hypothetical protein